MPQTGFWFREIFPKWLTLTYGQLIVGAVLGLAGFLFVSALDMAALKFWIAVFVAFKAFDEGISIVRTKPSTDDDS
jgi:hypothetical protein